MAFILFISLSSCTLLPYDRNPTQVTGHIGKGVEPIQVKVLCLDNNLEWTRAFESQQKAIDYYSDQVISISKSDFQAKAKQSFLKNEMLQTSNGSSLPCVIFEP